MIDGQVIYRIYNRAQIYAAFRLLNFAGNSLPAKSFQVQKLTSQSDVGVVNESDLNELMFQLSDAFGRAGVCPTQIGVLRPLANCPLVESCSQRFPFAMPFVFAA